MPDGAVLIAMIQALIPLAMDAVQERLSRCASRPQPAFCTSGRTSEHRALGPLNQLVVCCRSAGTARARGLEHALTQRTTGFSYSADQSRMNVDTEPITHLGFGLSDTGIDGRGYTRRPTRARSPHGTPAPARRSDTLPVMRHAIPPVAHSVLDVLPRARSAMLVPIPTNPDLPLGVSPRTPLILVR